MHFSFIVVVIAVALTSIEAGVLTNVRSFIVGTMGKVKDRMSKRKNEGAKGTKDIVLDITPESVQDTVDYLTAENDDLRRTIVALRMMVRNQKKQLADLRKEKESIRSDLSLRLSDVEKQHAVDKEGLRKRLEQEHQGEIGVIKAEMLQKVASKAEEADAAVQLTLKQFKQIAAYEEQAALSLKDIADLKCELKDKDAAMKVLENTSTATTDDLKQELRVIKELGNKAVGGTSGSASSAVPKASPASTAVEVTASGSTIRSENSSSSSSSGVSGSSGSSSEAETIPKIDLMKDLAKKAVGGGKASSSTSTSTSSGQAKKRKEPAESEFKPAPGKSYSSLKRSSLPKKTSPKPRSTGASSKGSSK